MSGRWTAAARAIKAHMEERESLIGQLRTELTDARGIAERFRAIAEMTHWAELESGTSVAEGDRVRYMMRTYECTTAHTKALTRAPLNEAYWREVAA